MSPAILRTEEDSDGLKVERPVRWVVSGGPSVRKQFRVLWSKGGDGEVALVRLEADRDGVSVYV